MEASLIYNNSLFIGKETENKKPSSVKNGLIIGAIGVSSLLIVPKPLENLSNLNYTSSQNSIQSFNISNEDNIYSLPVSSTVTENSAIMNMNNDPLEVADLVDKVTQTQINEIKSHFDTKIEGLEKYLKSEFSTQLQSTASELKDYISEENKKAAQEKNSKWRFIIGSILVPFAIAIGSFLLAKYLS